VILEQGLPSELEQVEGLRELLASHGEGVRRVRALARAPVGAFEVERHRGERSRDVMEESLQEIPAHERQLLIVMGQAGILFASTNSFEPSIV
jgi:hypothetical protein